MTLSIVSKTQKAVNYNVILKINNLL